MTFALPVFHCATAYSSKALGKDVADQRSEVGMKAGNPFARRMESQAHEAVRQVACDMGAEIAQNFALSKANIAITDASAPLLPQLIATWAAVYVIKTALRIACSGF